MKVVLLAGGKGTRYDIDRPKALAIIGDKVIIYHLMEIYSTQGFNDFIIAIGWKGDVIKNYLESLDNDYNITYVDTGENTNTGKRIKLIEDYIDNDNNFFCTYADGLANIDLHKLKSTHLSKDNIATITIVRPYNQFGIVKLDNNGQVKSFVEKPRMNEWTNGGFFIFNKRIFNYIDNDKTSNDELEVQVFDRLTKINKLGYYRHEGFWETLNTPKDEIRLNNIYYDNNKERHQPWNVEFAIKN